jgi:hypothetical protein
VVKNSSAANVLANAIPTASSEPLRMWWREKGTEHGHAQKKVQSAFHEKLLTRGT